MNRELLGSCTLMGTYAETCFKITKDHVVEEPELATAGHDEGDTRLIIHAKHALTQCPSVVVISEDTDIFIILLGLHTEIGNNGFFFLEEGSKIK